MITRESLKGTPTRFFAHLDGSGFYIDIYTAVEHPRLAVNLKVMKGTGEKLRSYTVDSLPCTDLDDAIAKLNVVAPPTVWCKCETCRVPVPLDKVDLPGRCNDPACPVPGQAKAIREAQQ